MKEPKRYRTVELGDGIIDVTFLRGKVGGEDGWWCIRTGKNFDYQDLGFHQGNDDDPRWAYRKTNLPTPKNAADAVHMAFCDETGEGLTCPTATAGNVAIRGQMGPDGVIYTVIAKRTRTEPAPDESQEASLF